MRTLDWWVLGASIVFIVAYGLWKGRRSSTLNEYLLAGKTMPWYAMALSIMATQASAITFISTTGQAYTDGMRFVQFYFGLPLAMIIISLTAVPIFHRTKVYTAYEYLEKRFDAKTRALVSIIFLIQRGLAVGVALYAPAIVLTVIFGWPDRWTTIIMGTVVVAYTTIGGIKAVTWTDFQQMLVMFVGLIASLAMAIHLLPSDVSFTDAIRLAGAAGRLNAVVTTFDWNDRYNLWNGLLGGMFLALAYFGCDQSQVQRYLTGRSITQSRLSLLFNAVAKIPMQFAILLVGAIVFVFFIFEKPPILFHRQERIKVEQRAGYPELAKRYDRAFEERRTGAREFLESGNPLPFRQAHDEMERVRKQAAAGVNDTNYIFLDFVTRYLPAGIVGLIMAAIFAAAMSTIAGELSALSTTTVIDFYRRWVRDDGDEAHLLWVSKVAMLGWSLFASLIAIWAVELGSLIEVVNRFGSFFYGSILGVFLLAIGWSRANSTGAFTGLIAGMGVVAWVTVNTSIAFLWHNLIGAVVVFAVAMIVSELTGPRRIPEP